MNNCEKFVLPFSNPDRTLVGEIILFYKREHQNGIKNNAKKYLNKVYIIKKWFNYNAGELEWFNFLINKSHELFLKILTNHQVFGSSQISSVFLKQENFWFDLGFLKHLNDANRYDQINRMNEIKTVIDEQMLINLCPQIRYFCYSQLYDYAKRIDYKWGFSTKINKIFQQEALKLEKINKEQWRKYWNDEYADAAKRKLVLETNKQLTRAHIVNFANLLKFKNYEDAINPYNILLLPKEIHERWDNHELILNYQGEFIDINNKVVHTIDLTKIPLPTWNYLEHYWQAHRYVLQQINLEILKTKQLKAKVSQPAIEPVVQDNKKPEKGGSKQPQIITQADQLLASIPTNRLVDALSLQQLLAALKPKPITLYRFDQGAGEEIMLLDLQALMRLSAYLKQSDKNHLVLYWNERFIYNNYCLLRNFNFQINYRLTNINPVKHKLEYQKYVEYLIKAGAVVADNEKQGAAKYLIIKAQTMQWFDPVANQTITFQLDQEYRYQLVNEKGEIDYQFIRIINDHLENVKTIFRRTDVPSAVGNTIKQIAIYRIFGWALPQIVHLRTSKIASEMKDGAVNIINNIYDYPKLKLMVYLFKPDWREDLLNFDELIKKYPVDLEQEMPELNKSAYAWLTAANYLGLGKKNTPLKELKAWESMRKSDFNNGASEIKNFKTELIKLLKNQATSVKDLEKRINANINAFVKKVKAFERPKTDETKWIATKIKLLNGKKFSRSTFKSWIKQICTNANEVGLIYKYCCALNQDVDLVSALFLEGRARWKMRFPEIGFKK